MVRWGLLLLVVPLAILLGTFFWEYGEVRECQLSGGYWDYLAAACRETPQPFVPFILRHPWLVNGGMLISVLGLVMCCWGFLTKRK